MHRIFDITRPLRFGDCDLTGNVYLAHYFDTINLAVERWFEQGLGMPFDAFHLEHGYGNPIVDTRCEFLRPCRYGEILTGELPGANLGRSSIELRITGKVGAEERIRARHTTAMVSLENFRSVAIPDELRQKMIPYRIGPGDEHGAPAARRTPRPAEHRHGRVFRSRQPIRYSHCDPSEIVYFPRFFDLFINALEDWFAQELGSPWSGDLMGPRNLRLPTAAMACRFVRGCRLGDPLDLDLRLTRMGRSSIELALAGTVAGQERLHGAWTLCVVAADTFEAIPIPADIRARMAPFLVGST